MSTLHYIYDPLCGWCYGAAPLVKAAREILAVQAHGGGMMTGANRQRVTPQLRAYVKQHDARIAQQSGAAVQRHIEATRQLMAELGIHGFPGFVLERDGEWQRIEIGNYLGRPQAFQAWLQGQVPGQVGGKPTDGAACRIDGCV